MGQEKNEALSKTRESDRERYGRMWMIGQESNEKIEDVKNEQQI